MVNIGSKNLSLDDFFEILFNKQEINLEKLGVEKVNTNHLFLKSFSAEKLIYGINTGFGPMAQYKVSDERALDLQYNLIRSHSSGGGNLMSPLLVRALMVARLNSLMKAYSGVHVELVELLRDLINRDVIPCIYEHGGVGASGDLVQLAHLGLVLIGEGRALYEDKMYATADLFRKLGIKP
ncbi:MAG TPA: aromatic amino acid lyase, partial [Puia sp.]|nr:aromatic amino acid lyase [Puia sp.]